MSFPGFDIAFVVIMFVICLVVFVVFFCLQLGGIMLFKGKKAANLPLGIAAIASVVFGLGWLALVCLAPEMRLELSMNSGTSMPAYQAVLRCMVFSISGMLGSGLARLIYVKVK